MPRLRICGEPTVRAASASAGNRTARSGPSPPCRSAPPRAVTPVLRDQPRARHLVEVEQRRRRRRSSEADHDVGAALMARASGRWRAAVAPRRVRGENVHGATVRFLPRWPRRFRAASPSPAGTSRGLVVRVAGLLDVRASVEIDVAVVDGFVAGLGDYEGTATIDASDRYVVPGFVDAHAPRVVEAPRRRVRATRAAVRDDGRRRRPARDRERARYRRCPLAADVCSRIPLDVWFMASPSAPHRQSRSVDRRRPRRRCDVGA